MDVCAGCGHANVPGTLFCEECGLGLMPEAQGQRYATGSMSASVPADPRRAPSDARSAWTVVEETADQKPMAPSEAEETAAPASPLRGTRTMPPGMGTMAPGGHAESYDDRAIGLGDRDFTGARSAPPMGTGPRPAAAGPGPAEPPRPVTAATAYLISESGRRVDVPAQDVVIVGREDMRSGIRPDVDLTLDGASAAGVSRRHCRLLRQSDGWYLEDLMSTNFTVLNGKALTAHSPSRLHDGDDVRLGKLRLKFHEMAAT